MPQRHVLLGGGGGGECMTQDGPSGQETKCQASEPTTFLRFTQRQSTDCVFLFVCFLAFFAVLIHTACKIV